MIKGIGTDIVAIQRIQRSLERNDGFAQLVFSEAEIEYCKSKGKPAESFAGKFAAKEAFLKAIGTGWRGKIKLSEVAIINDELGKPEIELQGETQVELATFNKDKFHVSISHTADIATAFVIIEG